MLTLFMEVANLAAKYPKVLGDESPLIAKLKSDKDLAAKVEDILEIIFTGAKDLVS